MTDRIMHWGRVKDALAELDREHERQGVERSAAAREADRVAHDLHEQIKAERTGTMEG